MPNYRLPNGLAGKELHKFLIANKHLLIQQKKSEIKKCDFVERSRLYIDNEGRISNKADNAGMSARPDMSKMELSVVINTSNLMDSHDDVHIPGLWKKSIKDNAAGFYLLEMHTWDFDNVIGDGLKAETRQMAWAELGAKYPGYTEALIFNGIIESDRNPDRFSDYAKGYIKEHSVGMRYVSLLLCLNDDDYKEEYTNWNQYIGQVANRSDAEDQGYFWAVLEAKIAEGSAVLKGSNWITPTLSTEVKNDGTYSGPTDVTHDEPQYKSFLEIIKETNFVNI